MQGIFKKLTAGVASAALVAVLFATPTTAEAGRRHGSSGSSGGSSSSHGSSGSSGGSSSSHGSSGSSGGSSSSHGSSGSSGSSSSHGSSGSSGGWRRHGSSGSSSSHGSSGSSGGWYSSHGSSGSSSSHGSSGSSGGEPAAAATETTAIVTPATQSAMLVVKVPADAAVYLGDHKMSLTGKERKFRIPVAEAGKEYSYAVRVEIVRDGKTLVSRTTHKVRAGQQLDLSVAESIEEGKLIELAKN